MCMKDLKFLVTMEKQRGVTLVWRVTPRIGVYVVPIIRRRWLLLRGKQRDPLH